MTNYVHPIIQNRLSKIRVRMLIQIASFSLFWEKFWPRLFPPMGALGFFLAIALLDFLPMLPFWLHILSLAGFVGLLVYSIRGLVAADYRVSETQARRRIEIDSGIKHRPLESLDDNLVMANTDPNSEYIWRIHKSRMVAKLEQLKLSLPSPGMARHDPFCFRFSLLLVLVIACTVGIGDARARLERALIPEFGAFKSLEPDVKFWITPPAYTALAPIFLENISPERSVKVDKLGVQSEVPQASVIRVPVGSSFLGQFNGVEDEAALVIGQRKVPFTRLGPTMSNTGARVEGTIAKSDAGVSVLKVDVGGRVTGAWPVQIEVDQAPKVRFTQRPKKRGRGLFLVEFEARDDFGISDVDMIIRNPQGWPVPGGKTEIKIDLVAEDIGKPRVKGAISQDLINHPWAGMQVNLMLRTTDAAGQAASSENVAFILPERIFNHPVARAIVKARKELNRPERPALLSAIRGIEDVLTRPAHFFGDTAVFLNLVVSLARLQHNGSSGSVAEVQKLLWKTAVRLEDGEFAIADRNLAGVQRQLLDAFRNGNMSSMELNTLVNKLQAAMNNYMRALVERFKRKGLANTPQLPAKKIMESGDLQRMIDQIRELTQTGSVEAAKQLFARLNQMLEVLRHGAQMTRQQRGLSRGQKILQGVRKLSSRQQQLLDDTFRKIQRRNMLETRQPSLKIANQQEALRRGLDKLMRQVDKLLGAIPKSMGEAERAMKGAGLSLKRGNRAEAVSWQTKALGELRTAAEGLAESLVRRMQDQKGISLGRQRQQSPDSRDPFGRRPGIEGANGEFGDGSVKIPSGNQIRRSREILDELRFRSSDPNRTKIELKYINRLIRQF